jgi:hypothetical protein
MSTLNTDPNMHLVGVHEDTVMLLQTHEVGKALTVQPSPDHHGGYVVSLHKDLYAQIGAICEAESISIESAIRKYLGASQ